MVRGTTFPFDPSFFYEIFDASPFEKHQKVICLVAL